MDTLETATPSEFQPIFDAGKEQVIQTEVGGIPTFIVPNNMKVEALDRLIQETRERPARLDQTVTLLSAESFVEYFNRYATESSTIFVDIESGQFIAVFDYHESPGLPAWKKHRAVYSCPQTKEWNSWSHFDNQKMEQEEFALFIEDNLNEIIEPNGAQMLEIAASLKAKTNVDFKSSIRLDNGQTQFVYSEKVDGQAGATGQLEIPEKIKLAIKPFQQGAPYELEARFRYRITQGGLRMWYTLIRPHLIHQDAVNDVFNMISEGKKCGHIIQAKAP